MSSLITLDRKQTVSMGNSIPTFFQHCSGVCSFYTAIAFKWMDRRMDEVSCMHGVGAAFLFMAWHGFYQLLERV